MRRESPPDDQIGPRAGTQARSPARASVALTPVALVVQKYGGSSVASADHMKRVAERIVAAKKDGNDVVVVVSARVTPPTSCSISPPRSPRIRPAASSTCS